MVDIDDLIHNVEKMLTEAADCLEENHLEMEEPNLISSQAINRVLRVMEYKKVESSEQAFNGIMDGNTPKEVTMRNIFLDMIPHTGTTAERLCTNIISKQ